MTVAADQIARLRESFAELQATRTPPGDEFYRALFARAPELRPMFREDDLAGQGMKFMTTLGVLVADMDDPEKLAPREEELGRLHRTLGVHAAHFEPMGEALIDMLRNRLGARFTPETEAAWRAAYAELVARMVEKGDIPD